MPKVTLDLRGVRRRKSARFRRSATTMSAYPPQMPWRTISSDLQVAQTRRSFPGSHRVRFASAPQWPQIGSPVIRTHIQNGFGVHATSNSLPQAAHG